MSESLRNSGRIWVPKSRETAEKIRKKEIKPSDVPEEERDYYLERKYPSFGNLAPRDISSRAAKEACDDGRGVAITGKGVFLDFADEIKRMAANGLTASTATCSTCTRKSRTTIPMKRP